MSYFGLLVRVPGEGNGIVGNLLNVVDCVEALLIVSWRKKVQQLYKISEDQRSMRGASRKKLN